MAGRRRPRQALPLVDRIRDGRIFQVSRRTDAGTMFSFIGTRLQHTSSLGQSVCDLPLTFKPMLSAPMANFATIPKPVSYLRCQNTRICQATAKLVRGEIQLLNRHSDFCHEDERVEPISRFKAALQESLRQHWWGLRNLYDTMAQVYPEAAEWVPYQTIKGSMKRWRRASYPPAPANIQEFVRSISEPEFERNLEYESGRLQVNLITDHEGHNHALIYDADFIRREMQNVDRLFVDGTFRTRPRLGDAYQLVTIIGIKFNHGIPFMWCVMSRKTQIAYTAVFSHVRDNLIPGVRIRLVMSDFEVALRNSIQAVFPEAQSTGCNTHFDRALLRKAKSLGLQGLIQRDPVAKDFMKTIMALAYLPRNDIQAQYERVQRQLPQVLRHRFRAFLSYFERFWLRRVGPDRFSVHGLSRRTNNISESYNSRLRHNLQDRPEAWDFICKLLKMQAQAKADVARLRNGHAISRHPRYASIYKRNELTRAWRSLHLQMITPAEFLEIAARLKGDVSQEIRVLRDREAAGEDEDDDDIDNVDIQGPQLPSEDDLDYDGQLFAVNPPEWLLRDNAIVQVNPEAIDDAGAPRQVLRRQLRLAGDDRNNGTEDSATSTEDSDNALDEEAEDDPMLEANIEPVDVGERPWWDDPIDVPVRPAARLPARPVLVAEDVPVRPAARFPAPPVLVAEDVPVRPAARFPAPPVLGAEDVPVRPAARLPAPPVLVAEDVPVRPAARLPAPPVLVAEDVPVRPAARFPAPPVLVAEDVPVRPAARFPAPPVLVAEDVPVRPAARFPAPPVLVAEDVPVRPAARFPAPPVLVAEDVPVRPAVRLPARPVLVAEDVPAPAAAPLAENVARNMNRRNRRKRRRGRSLEGPVVPGVATGSPTYSLPSRRRADQRKRIVARVEAQARLQIEALQAEVARQRALTEAAEAEAERQRALAEAARAESLRQRMLAETAQSALERLRETPFELCVMCVSNPMSHAFWPCGHMLCCGPCAYRIYIDINHVCPICRTDLNEPPLNIRL